MMMTKLLSASVLRAVLVAFVGITGLVILSPLLTQEVSTMAAADRITQPPLQQIAENGPYRLEITAQDSWRSPVASAQLSEDGVILWQQVLPHQYGPRFFLVSSTGQVVLFDEYINVASRYAIALISPNGTTIAQYSFDDIHATLENVSRADLTRQASNGWWISAPPTFSTSGDSARVETGGTTLKIDLATGELTRLDEP